MIGAYEDILTYERASEREVLNKRRFEEYEMRRPPKDYWYELKDKTFQKELYRN